MTTSMTTHAVIGGAGPAGLTAALELLDKLTLSLLLLRPQMQSVASQDRTI